MVVRIASTGFEVLNFNNAADNFGLDDDVLIIKNSYGPMGVVATFAGDDIIVLNNFAQGGFGAINSGAGNDQIYGGNGIEVVSAGSGDDFIYTGRGNDEIYADRGNDVYDGGAGQDFIHFSVIDSNVPGGGVANNVGVICDLAISGPQNFGVFGFDTLINIENIFGGGGNDRFFGTDGINVIEGRGGNDFIDGRGGNDVLFCFSGKDTVTGGLGADFISMDEGGFAFVRDVVIFNAVEESGITAATRDVINGFDRGGAVNDDKIDLRNIDANVLVAGDQKFAVVGALTGAGQLQITNDGTNTLVSVSIDADADAEMTFQLANVVGITAVDFFL